jgi:hypothetical protein
MKPKQLTLEFIENALAESCLYLELKNSSRPVFIGRSRRAGTTMFRATVDTLPSHARLVVRLLGGAAMPVAKGSLWNGHGATYDGRHSKMTPVQIRAVIIRSLE